MPRKKANIPANETPAQRFVRLANQKVNTILKGMKGLGTLHGTNYVSSADQRKVIKVALTEGVDTAMQAMEGKTISEFKL